MRTPPRPLLWLLLGLALLTLLLAIAVGSGPVGPAAALTLMSGQPDPAALEVILYLRLPRALAAFGCGAALALAGAMMQVLLRNPLADPYVLGTSGGAAVGALLAIMAGLAPLLVDFSAFAGALLSTLLVFSLAGVHGQWSAGKLLLTGVVVAAGWSAVVSVMVVLSPDASLRGILFWLMGDFSFVRNPLPTLAVAGTIGLLAWLLARYLNVLSAGEREAALLGMEVPRMKLGLYAASALLTSTAVTTAGVVGFVGLVVPHMIRLLTGNSDHRVLVPAALLAGGTLLTLADLLSRTLIAPRQLPVGAITAAVGVPLFLVLLRRRAGT
ncbi:MAG: iron ABC transporter permease [Chromatiales bacterium]|nr:iron ABC transporter permease [Chromatiales bacterium]